MNAEDLLQLPWTWIGPRQETDGGETYWVATISELDGFVVAGATQEEVERERRIALKVFLQSYLDDNELPPLPEWKLGTPDSTDVTARPFDFTGVTATVSRPLDLTAA